MTAAEVAERLGVPKSWVYKLSRAGRIPTVALGRYRRFREEAVAAWIEQSRVYETVDHPAARALTGYLLVRGGVHQVAYARALELVTGADLTKTFPMPRIPTTRSPSAAPPPARLAPDALPIQSLRRLPEAAAVFTGAHPETGEQLRVEHPAPEGYPWPEAPAEQDVFAPDYAPGEIAEIAQRLRNDA
jgi:Mn-containing catalase